MLCVDIIVDKPCVDHGPSLVGIIRSLWTDRIAYYKHIM